MTQTENYFNKVAISNSSIKDWKTLSPRQWKRKWIDKVQDQEPEQAHFTFGSLVDTILFTPKLLNERFYVADFALPSKTVESIIRNVYRSILVQNESIALLNTEPIPVQYDMRSESLEGNEDLVLRAANDVETVENGETKIGWQKNWKEETRIKKLIEEGGKLFQVLADAGQRQIITAAMNMQAAELAEILKKDETVKDYFIPKEGEELLFQLELEESCGANYLSKKCAIDICRINHIEEWIQLSDFKTAQSAFSFVDNIKKYGYDSQLSFYNDMITEWKYKQEKLKDYTVLDPINIVIDTKEKIPYIYEYSAEDLSIAKRGNGKYTCVIDEDYKVHDLSIRERIGWKDIVEEIQWHWINNKWDKPREMYENGKIKLNLLNS